MIPAFHTIPAKWGTPLFIFGDHSSNIIPPEFDNLGLSGEDLTRHIAWDIGTEDLIRELCQIYGCGGHLAGFSRLVIDPNRDVSSSSLIPAVTDGTRVPGNQDLSGAARQSRIDRFYQPYHDGLATALDSIPDDTLVISLHSFTPKPLEGDPRRTDIGLLVKHDVETAKACQDQFNSKISRYYDVGINEPYSAYDLNHTVDFHVAPRGLRHLAIEVRQDHVETESRAKDMAMILDKVLHDIVHGNYAPILPGGLYTGG